MISKGLIYDDLRLELIDHIATDIELESEESNFDDAFSKVFEKWNSLLEKTSSFWSSNVAPKIVVERHSSLFKRYYKLSFLSTVVFGFLMATITILNQQEYVYNVLKLVFASAYILLCLSLLICLFLIWKLNLKTIYGRFFQINCGYLGMHFYIIYTYLNGHTHLYHYYQRESFFSNFTEWFVSGFFFFMSIYTIMAAIEHFKMAKKYKLV